jgi:hypothetical protein
MQPDVAGAFGSLGRLRALLGRSPRDRRSLLGMSHVLVIIARMGWSRQFSSKHK